MKAQEFEHIYMSTKAKLSAIARRYSMAVDFDLDEQDVVQEALTAFWELSEKGYPVRNPEALLVKITKNICVGRYRRRKGREETLGAEALAVAGPEEDREILDETEVKQLFKECLTKTEYKYMMMKFEDEMTLDEMAESTGRSKAGIKMAISRGRRKLHDKMNRR